MNTKEFKREVNNRRKDNKNNWFTFVGVVEGKLIELKCFETWIQIFRVIVDGKIINHSSTMNVSVKEFNQLLELPFKSEVK